MRSAHRILKTDGSAYVFSGWNNLRHVLNAADEIGFRTINHIIWKYQFGVVTRRRYVSSHYHCLYLCKDDSKRRFYPFSRYAPGQRSASGGSAHYLDKEDVWTIQREYWPGVLKTPTKLPRSLIEKILAYSSIPGDLIFDPFMGSGQVAVVSKLNERRFFGFEIVPAYHEFILKRLAAGQYKCNTAA